MNLEKITGFTNLLFSALQASKLLPTTLDRPFKEYEQWPKLLIERIEHSGVNAGYLEWMSEAMKASHPDFDFLALQGLQTWVEQNQDVFDKATLSHLKASVGGRAHEYIYSRNTLPSRVISLAEAQRRWGKTNLRQNAGAMGLQIWQDVPGSPWRTTVDEMERVYGLEPKGKNA